MRSLVVRGARQHNLRGFTLELPHGALIVLTGPSGSGKSSLAFDTIYAEGQRRYIESLSTYAKQFLERMPRPAVDAIEGIAPAVAIEQKNPTTSSRSTVGTATEIYDYLRLLWARVGRARCVACGGEVRSDTVQEVVDRLLALGGDFTIAFPLPPVVRATHAQLVENLLAMGFVRVMVEGAAGRGDAAARSPGDARLLRLEELPPDLDLGRAARVLVVVDRLAATPANAERLADSVGTAFTQGDGTAVAVPAGGERATFSATPRCLACGTGAPILTPALFSFNHPRGACPGCNGFGAVLEYDEHLIVPDPGRTLAEGAIDPWTKPRYDGRRRLLKQFCRDADIPFDAPWSALPVPARERLLHARKGRYLGIFPFLRRLERKRYKQYVRVFLRQYQMASECPACGGRRLRPEALAVLVGGHAIGAAAAMTAAALGEWLAALALGGHDRAVAGVVLEELAQRLRVLNDVGLGYLTLDRQTRTLSGGEAQRISLANALGGKLTETLYVLDEPTIGLHPRDTDRLLALLRRLADQGNTVLAVEHDPAAMRAADWLVELGPGAGEHGGSVVFEGTGAQLAAAHTLTASYLSGERRIAVPSVRRRIGPRWITVEGATAHNLSDLTVAIPVGTLTVVTGVSGSGKSTLVNDVLFRQLERHFEGRHTAKEHLGEVVGGVRRITGLEALDGAVLVDQSPIGRTPRSNPVTYIKAFDEIRELFAAAPLARARRYTPATFSFNVSGGGRCDVCEGAGHVQVEMVFLADVFVPCEACNATRYRPAVLDVKLAGFSIADVLQFTVDEALRRFRHQERLGRALWHLAEVGLGYLRLGQPATTLSGGEAQRLKIARELAAAGRRRGRKLYILDEPTTGLHLDDVRVLLGVLDRLVDAGNTVLVIEHHLDVIKRADWVIDLGPGAGAEGGRVVVAGPPEDVGRSPESVTGRYLQPMLGAEAPALTGGVSER
ncbi:MAG TPA: excinuclease ABC subunit UvrA [Gemmatimonadales bacterium]|nr:excinuclease ABC subunit UvrA [Gemmatimonadales bacterium]